MKTGALNRQVVIEGKNIGQDAAGQPINTWAQVATVWGDIRYLGGLESIRAGAEVGVSRASIRIRYRTGLTPGMRVVYGATVFDIESVLPDERKREYVDLMAATGANNG